MPRSLDGVGHATQGRAVRRLPARQGRDVDPTVALYQLRDFGAPEVTQARSCAVTFLGIAFSPGSPGPSSWGPTSKGSRAGASGGAAVGRPRWAKVRRTTRGSERKAKTTVGAEQRAQVRASTSKTRRSSAAQGVVRQRRTTAPKASCAPSWA